MRLVFNRSEMAVASLGAGLYNTRNGPTSVGLEGTNGNLSFSFTGPLFSDVEKKMQASKQASGSIQSGKEVTTWKRNAQGDVEADGPRKKRDIQGEAHIFGLATKGVKVSGQAREWRRLCYSPADHNEDIELELPRAWEPLDSSGASSVGEAKETLLGLSYGDQVT